MKSGMTPASKVFPSQSLLSDELFLDVMTRFPGHIQLKKVHTVEGGALEVQRLAGTTLPLLACEQHTGVVTKTASETWAQLGVYLPSRLIT